MAQYRVGDAGYYSRDGRRYFEGEKITLSDDEKPSFTFYPLDDKARAAFKKHHPNRKPFAPSQPDEPQDNTPRTMSEINKGRASDREPV